MGTRGPAPQPAVLRNLRQRSKKAATPPVPKTTRVGVPKPPPHIRSDAAALACWRTLAKSLAARGALTSRDVLAFEGLCRAYSRALKADKAVAKDGIVLKMWDGRLSANPAVTISRQAWIEVRKFAQEFGLTPQTRTKVPGMEASDDTPQERGNDGTPASESSPEDFLFRGSVVGRIGA